MNIHCPKCYFLPYKKPLLKSRVRFVISGQAQMRQCVVLLSQQHLVVQAVAGVEFHWAHMNHERCVKAETEVPCLRHSKK